MVDSDFIAVHRSTPADNSLSQHQLYALQIFVRVTRVAIECISGDRRRPMQNDGSLNAPLRFRSHIPMCDCSGRGLGWFGA